MSPYYVSFDNLGQYEIIYISSIFPIHITAKIASANLQSVTVNPAFVNPTSLDFIEG